MTHKRPIHRTLRPSVLLALLAALAAPAAEAASGYQPGQPIPDFSAPDQFGVSRSVSEWSDRVVVLHFCTLWCSPCQSYASSTGALRSSLDASVGSSAYQIVEVVLADGSGRPSTQTAAQAWTTFAGADLPILHAGGDSGSPIFDAWSGFAPLGTPFFAVLAPGLRVFATGVGANYDVEVAVIDAVAAGVSSDPIANPDTYRISPGSTLNVDAANGVLANDGVFDGADLSVQLVAGPLNDTGFGLALDGSFTFEAPAVFSSDTFTYRACDDGACSDVTNVRIEDSSLPTARPDRISGTSVPTGEGFDFFLLDSPPMKDGLLPPSIDEVLLANDSGPNGSLFIDSVQGLNPSWQGWPLPSGLETELGIVDREVCLTEVGCFRQIYTASTPGFRGVDSFLYRGRDGLNRISAPAQVSIEVTDRPWGVDYEWDVSPGEPLSVSQGVLSTSVPQAGLTAYSVAEPLLGSLTLKADGSFVYFPGPAFDGAATDEFGFQLTDGTLSSAVHRVTLRPREIPRGHDDVFEIESGALLQTTAGVNGILDNDTDPQGDVFSFGLIELLDENGNQYQEDDGMGGILLYQAFPGQNLPLPNGAVIQVESDGSFTYQAASPGTDPSYVHDFHYWIQSDCGVCGGDANGGPNHLTIAVNAAPPNNPPSLTLAGPYEVPASTGFLLDGAEAVDPDGDDLTFDWSADGGGFDDASASVPTWTAPASPGFYKIMVAVSDGEWTASAEADVLVYEPAFINSPPTADAGGPYVVEIDGSVQLDGTNSSDPDGDVLSFVWTAVNGGFDDDSLETPIYQAPSSATIDSIQLTVTDSNGTDDTVDTDVVVYDPAGGFVIGNGDFYSIPGAMPGSPTAEGPASFRFLAAYRRGANVPQGQTRFEFQTGGLRLDSVAYEWLVVAGSTARFKGDGELADGTPVKFQVWADDNETEDTFRIKIWDEVDMVYDNGMKSPLTAGMIRIQRPRK